MRPIVRAIQRHAESEEGSVLQFTGQLRDLASLAGISMLEAHRAIHQLIDEDLVSLEDEILRVPAPENLNAILDR
jgi:hypothetical protein